MKDHKIREFVNALTDAAKIYGETQQLRDRISYIVYAALLEEQKELTEYINSCLIPPPGLFNNEKK